MKLRIVDGNHGKDRPQSCLMSYVIDDLIAIDAGAIGLIEPLDQQRQIKDVFLSHSHIDHIATLPLFVDNVYEPGPDCVCIHASEATIDDLKQHVFNDRVWPDVARIAQSESSFLRFEVVQNEKPVQIEHLRITPLELDHVIPTCGFLIEDEQSAIAILSDTAPVTRPWEILDHTPHLKAVFLEISFPNSMQWLAEKSKHLTPRDFQAETKKLRSTVEWIVIHVKPAFADALATEIPALQLPLTRARSGAEFEFY